METFSCYWPFVRGIHPSPVNSPRKGQWRGALMFSLIYAWTNIWVNNRDAGHLRRHRAHYGVIVMCYWISVSSAGQFREHPWHPEATRHGAVPSQHQHGCQETRCIFPHLPAITSAQTRHLYPRRQHWHPHSGRRPWGPCSCLWTSGLHVLQRRGTRIQQCCSSGKVIGSVGYGVIRKHYPCLP